MSRLTPCLLTVAPNGARRGYADHAGIPLTPEEIAVDAKACLEAGAGMLHLHVRDDQGRHLLDAQAYRRAIDAVRDAVGDDLIIQVTTEAAGHYAPAEQMAVIRELEPEAVSLAIRELLSGADEADGGAFCHWLAARGIATQYILYAPEELERFYQLRRCGVLPPGEAFLLFVLGRYADPPIADPDALGEFLALHDGNDPWAVCAFGVTEADCMQVAARHGGHARVGFENNLQRPDGTLASGNAELVRIARERIEAEGRCVIDAAQAREFFNISRVGREGRS